MLLEYALLRMNLAATVIVQHLCLRTMVEIPKCCYSVHAVQLKLNNINHLDNWK